MTKYSYTKKCGEISGMGGDYEKACRKMVIAGVGWATKKKAELKFSELTNVFGLIKAENKESEELQSQMTKAVDNDCTGAMMHACVGHVMFVLKNGWDKYIKEMEAPDKGNN